MGSRQTSRVICILARAATVQLKAGKFVWTKNQERSRRRLQEHLMSLTATQGKHTTPMHVEHKGR
jgi:hypothetical protein